MTTNSMSLLSNTSHVSASLNSIPNITNNDPNIGHQDKQGSERTPFSQGIQLMLVSPADQNRSVVEKFIADGYAKHFDAKLVEFFPIILAIKDIKTDRLLGAVGLRYADDYKLFSEKYLSHSIERTISINENIQIQRNDVIELGHFIVDQSSDVNLVIPMLAKFLKTLDVKWAVYTLSRPIKVAFSRMGIKLTHLQHAHPEALSSSKTDWGKYYDFKPAVYYSNILSNMN